VGRRHERPRVAGRNDGIGLSVGHEFNGPAERGVGLPADGLDGRLGHADPLAGVDDLEAVAAGAGGVEFGLDGLGVADEEKGIVREDVAGADGAADDLARRVIAAHGVNRQPHRLLLLDLDHLPTAVIAAVAAHGVR